MTQLTTDPTPDWAPSWSPDGTQIAFYAFRSGNRDVWLMPSNGGAATQLTSHTMVDTTPSWSSDGTKVAFTSSRSDPRGVWSVDVNGGEPHELAANGILGEWSPEGSSIVYGRDLEFWQKPVDGGEERRISRGPGAQARWSPDGTRLYYTGWRERSEKIWALSPSSGDESVVADLTGRRGNMGWQFATDGSFLYFTFWEDIGDMWVMDVEDG